MWRDNLICLCYSLCIYFNSRTGGFLNTLIIKAATASIVVPISITINNNNDNWSRDDFFIWIHHQLAISYLLLFFLRFFFFFLSVVVGGGIKRWHSHDMGRRCRSKASARRRVGRSYRTRENSRGEPKSRRHLGSGRGRCFAEWNRQ